MARIINASAEVWISSDAKGTNQNTDTWTTISINNSTANA